MSPSPFPPIVETKRDRDRNARRREKIAFGRKLYGGKWRELLLDIDRLAQHNYRGVKNHLGEVRALLVKVNVIRLAALKHADILLNETPSVTIADDFIGQSEAWERIADECLVEDLFHEAALTTNTESESWVRVGAHDGQTCLSLVDADEIFVLGELGHDKQPTIVDRRWVKVVKDSQGRERCYLRVERHSTRGGAGSIEHLMYRVDSKLAREIPPKAQPLEFADIQAILGDAAPPEQVQQTGVDRPLIFRLANRTMRGEPQPDIAKEDVDLIDQMAATFSQLARVMAKHVDPKMRVPQSVVDDKTGVADSARLEAMLDPNKEAEYLMFDAKLVDVLGVLSSVINWLLVTLEISPSLVGIKTGAAPESYEKLFLEAANTMSRADRVARTWRPIWERVITTALQFDSALVSPTGYPVERVAVNFRPGLPRTRGEIAAEYAAMNIAGQIDQLTMLEELHGVEKAAEIHERIQADNKAQAARMGFAGLAGSFV